MVISLRCS